MAEGAQNHCLAKDRLLRHPVGACWVVIIATLLGDPALGQNAPGDAFNKLLAAPWAGELTRKSAIAINNVLENVKARLPRHYHEPLVQTFNFQINSIVTEGQQNKSRQFADARAAKGLLELGGSMSCLPYRALNDKPEIFSQAVKQVSAISKDAETMVLEATPRAIPSWQTIVRPVFERTATDVLRPGYGILLSREQDASLRAIVKASVDELKELSEAAGNNNNPSAFDAEWFEVSTRLSARIRRFFQHLEGRPSDQYILRMKQWFAENSDLYSRINGNYLQLVQGELATRRKLQEEKGRRMIEMNNPVRIELKAIAAENRGNFNDEGLIRSLLERDILIRPLGQDTEGPLKNERSTPVIELIDKTLQQKP